MSHSVPRTGRGAGSPAAPSPTTRTPRPFGSLEELSLCHSTSHPDERFAEVVLTDPHGPECPESEMDRYHFNRVM